MNLHGSMDGVTQPAELNLRDRPDIPIETRVKWANGVIAIVQSDSQTPDKIRPWCLELFLNGTVSVRLEPTGGDVYPARYRIPVDAVVGSEHREAIKRAELFALGTLLYEIETGQKPFECLGDEEVQRKYGAGEFPVDVPNLKLGPLIYYYWESTSSAHNPEKSDDSRK